MAVGSFYAGSIDISRDAQLQQQLSQASVDERGLEDAERNCPDVKPGGRANKDLA